jgi:chromosome segregation ATPase
MQEKIQEINNLEVFFDEDPTEELPVLTDLELAEADAAEQDISESTGEAPILTLDAAVPETLPRQQSRARPSDFAPSGPRPGGLSLQRLESELQALQTRFLDLESDLRLRDDEIDQLQLVLAAREDAIGVLEAELETARQARETLREEQAAKLAGMDELRQEIAGLDTQLARAAAAETELRDSLEQVRAESAERLAKLEAERAARQEDASERARWDEQLAQGERGRAELLAKIADLETYIAGRADHWDALQNERDQQARSLAALEAASILKAEQLDRRSRELETLRAQLDEQRQLHGAVQAELAQSHSRVAELEQEVAGQQEEIARLCRTLGDIEGSADALQERLLERAQQIEQLTAGQAAAQARVEELEAEAAGLSQSLESRAAELQELEAEAAARAQVAEQHATRIEELEANLEEARAQSSSLEEQLAAATQSGASVTSAREASEKRANALAEQVASLETQLAQVSRQLEAALAADRELTALADERADALSLAQSELLAAATQRDEFSTQLAESEADRTGLREANQKLAERLARRDATIEALQAEIGEQRETIETLSREAAHMADLEARIRSLDDRLTDAKVRETEERSGSITRVMVTINSDRAIKYPLYKRTMTIGRAADSDIRIRRQYISRHHARLHQDDGVTYIEDLGSKNGVRVNDAPVDRQPLRNGDLVDIGQMQFRYIDLASPGSEANA